MITITIIIILIPEPSPYPKWWEVELCSRIVRSPSSQQVELCHAARVHIPVGVDRGEQVHHVHRRAVTTLSIYEQTMVSARRYIRNIFGQSFLQNGNHMSLKLLYSFMHLIIRIRSSANKAGPGWSLSLWVSLSMCWGEHRCLWGQSQVGEIAEGWSRHITPYHAICHAMPRPWTEGWYLMTSRDIWWFPWPWCYTPRMDHFSWKAGWLIWKISI